MLSVGLVCSEVCTGMGGSPPPSSIQALLAFLLQGISVYDLDSFLTETLSNAIV